MSREITQTMSALDQTLVDILQQVIETGKKATELLVEQTPLVILEMLNWYFAYYLILFVFSIILMAGPILAIKKVNAYNSTLASHTKGFPLAGFYTLWVMVTSMATIPFNLQWLKIWIAPKLFLIEKLAELTK